MQMLTDALLGLASLLEGAPDEACLSECCVRLLLAGLPEGEVYPPVCHPTVARAVRCLLVEEAKPDATPRAQLLAAALRFIGALLTAPGSESSDVAIATGALAALKGVLGDAGAPVKLRSQAAWALANLASTGPSQVERLLDEPGAWIALCEALERSGDAELRTECAWAVASVLQGGSAVLARLEVRRTLRRVASALKVARGPAGCPALLCTLLDGTDALLTYSGQKPTQGRTRKSSLHATAEECGFLMEVEVLRSASNEVGRRASMLLGHARLADMGTENVEPGDENMPPQQLQKVSSRKVGVIM